MSEARDEEMRREEVRFHGVQLLSLRRGSDEGLRHVATQKKVAEPASQSRTSAGRKQSEATGSLERNNRSDANFDGEDPDFAARVTQRYPPGDPVACQSRPGNRLTSISGALTRTSIYGAAGSTTGFCHGSLPADMAPREYTKFRRESECRAYTISKKCNEELLKTCLPACRSTVAREIDDAGKWLGIFRCSKEI